MIKFNVDVLLTLFLKIENVAMIIISFFVKKNTQIGFIAIFSSSSIGALLCDISFFFSIFNDTKE